MGNAVINAERKEIIQLVLSWCDSTNYRIISPLDSGANTNEQCDIPEEIVARSKFNKATWYCQNIDSDLTVTLSIKPCLLYSIILNALMLISFIILNVLMIHLFKIDNYHVGFMTIAFISFAYVIHRNDTRYLIRLSEIEQSFWDLTSQAYDYQQLTRTDIGKPSDNVNFFILALALLTSINLGLFFAGIIGFIVTLFFGAFLFITLVVNRIYKKDCQWQWDFWIVENLLSWTITMIGVIFFFALLLVFELLFSQTLNIQDPTISVKEQVIRSQLRDISPATSESLEKDIQRIIYHMAESNSTFHNYVTNPKNSLFYARDSAARMRLISSMVLGIQLIAISIIVIRRFSLTFNRARIWAIEICGKSQQQHPFVPNHSQAWKRRKPFSLLMIIVFHYILGSFINIIANLLCIDAFSYMVVGKALFFEKTANLMSWIFAPCKIVFGSNVGYIVGCMIVVLVSIPTCFLFGTFIRRTMLKFLLIVRFFRYHLHSESDNRITQLQNFIIKTCSKYELKKPILVVTKNKKVILRLQQLLLTNTAVIEISQGTIDLLTQEETMTAIAHELGHIRQGAWKVDVLKFLSSLAFFPNYYLTLCVNWATNEIDADRFAVVATQDPLALKQALVKMSTSQIIFATKPNKYNSIFTKFYNFIKNRLRLIEISIKFFFGDNLFGYNHPYLLERIHEIEKLN